MHVSVNRDTFDLLKRMLKREMRHFGSNTGQRNQVLIGVGYFTIVHLMDYLRGLLDIFSLLIVETHFGNPLVQVGGFRLQDCRDRKILLVHQVLRRSMRHLVFRLR